MGVVPRMRKIQMIPNNYKWSFSYNVVLLSLIRLVSPTPKSTIIVTNGIYFKMSEVWQTDHFSSVGEKKTLFEVLLDDLRIKWTPDKLTGPDHQFNYAHRSIHTKMRVSKDRQNEAYVPF